MRIVLFIATLLSLHLPAMAEDKSTVENSIKENIIFDPLATNEVANPDLIHAELQTGGGAQSVSSPGQYVLRLELAGEHQLSPKDSIRYLNVHFSYEGGADKSRLHFSLTPVEYGIKDLPSSDDSIFLGVLPFSYKDDQYLDPFSSIKVSLVATEANQTIPVHLATLILKESIQVLGAAFLSSPDQYGQSFRLEIFSAHVEAKLRVTNLVSFLAGASQSLYLEDFNHIFQTWVGTTSLYAGVDLGINLGDLDFSLYVTGGYRISSGKGDPYVEIGIKLSDVFALTDNKKKK